MLKNINGIWKLKSTENEKEYLKDMGIDGCEMVNRISKLEISLVEDHVVYMKRSNLFKKRETAIPIGDFQESVSFDGRTVKVKYMTKENKLIQIEQWEGNFSRTIYSVHDGQLIVDLARDQTVAQRVYKRIGETSHFLTGV